jgi:hypothetical protein
MPLPPVPEDELKLARAYANLALGDSPVPEGEEFYVLLARYGVLRMGRPDFLQDLAGAEAPRRMTPADRAWQSYCSEVCPACGEKKRVGKDWFGRECWNALPRDLRGNLWRGFHVRYVPEYIRALAILRNQGRKPAEVAHG